MEKVGVICTIPKNFDYTMYKLLEDLLNLPSFWVGSKYNEVLLKDKNDVISKMNTNEILTNDEIKNIISNKKSYFINANFTIYHNNVVPKVQIDNLYSFINSKCYVNISVVDNTQLLLLAKNSSMIEHFIEKYKSMFNQSIEFIYTDSPNIYLI
ncbi:DUF2691 family protein [Piscibacillus halophilus]|uniref:DUF2691 family protein n=1 Tax=Piscibacillus halophilus TaxID=571933 RepID=UPI001588EF96|nr:DUF2691 family protein [Piscibacillus halophilus]